MGRARQRPLALYHRPVFLHAVPDDDAVRDDILGKEIRARHAEWVEHQVLDRRLVGLAGDPLDHAPRQVEPRVVVGKHRAERRQLDQVDHARHDDGQRIVARPGIVEVVALPAGGVREKVAQGDARRHLLVGQAQLRQVGAQGRVQVEQAALDQAHRRRRRHRLGGRADLEQGIGRDLQRVVDIGHAEAGRIIPSLVNNADGDAWNVVALQRRRDLGAQQAKIRVGVRCCCALHRRAVHQ